MYRPITVKSRVRLPGDIISRLRLHQWSHPQPYQPGYLCGSPNLDWHLHATEGLPVLQNLQQNLRQPWARSPTIWLVHLLLHLPLRHPRQRDGSLHGHAWVAREPGIWRPQQERPHTQQQRTESWDNVSAFSYMERQTNISGLMAKLYMKRQAKSREKTLSLNQRQGNQIAYYTKTPCWISSKLTPPDASRSCASFCIWSHCHQNCTVVCIA